MTRRLICAVVMLGCILTGCSRPVGGGDVAQRAYPSEEWETLSSPGDAGWSLEKLARVRAYSEEIGSAAVMIVDDGSVVYAWGDLDRTYHCHSMRKSLLSALIGIHVAAGEIDLSKTMEELGIDDTEPSLTAEEKQATVGDLIRARSGIYHPALGEVPSMEASRPARHSHAPGTFWYYNNWDFNALGTIFEQETGTRIFEEFERRIAVPLQMEDFQIQDCEYETAVDQGTPGRSEHRYYGFRMSTRDLARFGLLFLRQGRWMDRQVLPADWVQESTASHSETGSGGGYGYMWWTGKGEGLLPNVQIKQHSYYASGYRGHKVIVLPYLDLVVVHRVNTDLPEPDIGPEKIGTLLWLILDAAGETGIGDPPFIEAASGVRLSGDELRTALERGRLETEGLGGLIIAFSESGQLTLSQQGTPVEMGTWWTEGDTYCHQLSPYWGGTWCGLVKLDGEELSLFDRDGTLFMRLDYLED